MRAWRHGLGPGPFKFGPGPGDPKFEFGQLLVTVTVTASAPVHAGGPGRAAVTNGLCASGGGVRGRCAGTVGRGMGGPRPPCRPSERAWIQTHKPARTCTRSAACTEVLLTRILSLRRVCGLFRPPSLPNLKQMTSLRQRIGDRAQWQNSCDKKLLLSLLVTQP